MGRLGLEPRTNGLKVHCSTIELATQLKSESDNNPDRDDESRGFYAKKSCVLQNFLSSRVNSLYSRYKQLLAAPGVETC